MFKRLRIGVILAVAGVLSSAIAMSGCEANAKPHAAKIKIEGENPEKKAKFLIGMWDESIRKNEHVSVLLTRKSELGGQLGPKFKNLNLEMVHEISLTRPNKLSVRHQSGSSGFNIVTNGTQSHMWPQPPMPNQVKIGDFSSRKLSELTLQTSLDPVSFGMSIINTPWQLLVFDEPMEFLNSNDSTATYTGTRELDGRLAHIIKISVVGGYLEVFFSDSAPPSLERADFFSDRKKDLSASDLPPNYVPAAMRVETKSRSSRAATVALTGGERSRGFGGGAPKVGVATTFDASPAAKAAGV